MKRALLTACLASALVGCAGTGEDVKPEAPPRRCPQVAILRALDTIEDHGSDSVDPANLVAVGKMNKVDGRCSYEDNGVDINFDLHLSAEKGPGLGGNKVSFPFFVSVLKPDDTVLGKEMMSVDFTFADKAKITIRDQSLHVFLPLKENEDASGFRVLIGYQLTEAQMKAKAKAD